MASLEWTGVVLFEWTPSKGVILALDVQENEKEEKTLHALVQGRSSSSLGDTWFANDRGSGREPRDRGEPAAQLAEAFRPEADQRPR